MTAWLDELNLDPTAVSLSMGTRRLGDRPWLVADHKAPAELALKAQLCEERHDDVFRALSDTVAPGAEVAQLVVDAGRRLVSGDDLHPLDRAGRSIQEDLCLLRRTDAGWLLVAASVCFPSRWRLADKIGRDLTAVHDPVAGYAMRLADGVDHLLDRLADHPVLRRNWFVHPDPALFQPDRVPRGDSLVPRDRVKGDLFVRSERQTLRALSDPAWVLFTIRVQQEPLAALLARRGDDFFTWLREVPDSERTHRGISNDQSSEILASHR